MNKLEKLLRKISEKERKLLKEIINKLIIGKVEEMDIKKIKGTDFLRLRKGRFRIIFHYNKNNVIIDSVKIRNENTYK
jgi:mRNA-degrading endonuclease RelE of RelBE toxin-antitoxin system